MTVLGNHDLHLLALHAGAVRFGKRFGTLEKLLNASDADELCDWLRHQPLAHYDKKLDTLLVHAGTHPRWSVKKTLARAAKLKQRCRVTITESCLARCTATRPMQWSDKLSGYKRLRFIINCLTRMRMVTADDHLDLNFGGSPWRARKGLRPWFDATMRQWFGSRVVFGHWSALGLIVLPDLISLDTGCVWGRQLTAVRLDKRLPRVVQVEGQR